MHIMHRVNGSLLALLMHIISYVWAKGMTEIEQLASSPKHCTYARAYDMYGAHCAGLRLSTIPSLRSGIEILDFSDNRLQELQTDTFSSYTSIKYLYLAENQIYFIDEDALTMLTYLQTLDLSNNVILQLPTSIFQLPSLRKLYLRRNPLLHMKLSELKISKPIKAPLELLDISDCKIRELPNWGNLPEMVFYNISHNPLTSLDPSHFSVMCNLKTVDLTQSISTLKICDIKSLISWFKEKNINFLLDDYSRLNSKEFDNCPDPDISAILNGTYHLCKSEYLKVQNRTRSRRTWLKIGGGLAGFLVGFILLLYIMHRHNVAQTKNTTKKLRPPTPVHDGDKHATAILLNEVS